MMRQWSRGAALNLEDTTMSATDPLLAAMKADEHREIGGVQVDIAKAGNVRVKRMIYPPRFNWDANLKTVIGTDMCMHAHVGFMAHGQINVQFADGCVVEYKAPQFVSVEPVIEATWLATNLPC